MIVLSPENLREALCMLQSEGSVLVAGCTNLLVDIKNGKLAPKILVDISGLAPLSGISDTGTYFRIGGGVTFTELEKNFLNCPSCASLAQAASMVGSPQIRNRGTVAGNVCCGSPASDCTVALLALDAAAELVSAENKRQLQLREIFISPGRVSVLSGEILTAFYIPKKRGKSCFLKAGKRNANAISIVSLAARLYEEGGYVKEISVSLGSVAPTPVRAGKCESYLLGKKLSGEDGIKHIMKAAHILMDDINPIDDIRSTAAYRRTIAGNMLIGALKDLRKECE